MGPSPIFADKPSTLSSKGKSRKSAFDLPAVLLVRAVGLFPRRAALALGARVGGLFAVFAKRKRVRAAFNFRRAGVSDSQQAARRAFRQLFSIGDWHLTGVSPWNVHLSFSNLTACSAV